jgi:hypothetical protein
MKKLKVKVIKHIRKGKNKATVVKTHGRSIKKPKRIGLSQTGNAKQAFKEHLGRTVHKSLGS